MPGYVTVIVEGNYTGVVRTLIAAATIENYRIESTGSSLLNVTGNVLTNFLTGNDANNVLSDGGFGGTGDTLMGFLGNDTYIVINITDILVESIDRSINELIRLTVPSALFWQIMLKIPP